MHNMDILVLRNLNIFHALRITTFERIRALRLTGQFVIGTERVNSIVHSSWHFSVRTHYIYSQLEHLREFGVQHGMNLICKSYSTRGVSQSDTCTT